MKDAKEGEVWAEYHQGKIKYYFIKRFGESLYAHRLFLNKMRPVFPITFFDEEGTRTWKATLEELPFIQLELFKISDYEI